MKKQKDEGNTKGNISKRTIRDLIERGRKISEQYGIQLTLEDLLCFVELGNGSNYELYIMAFEVGLSYGFKAGYRQGWTAAQGGFDE